MPKKYEYYLSKNDCVVPDDFIPVWDLFSEPKYALPGYPEDQWCIGAKALDEMRRKTYREFKKRYDMSKAISFSSYWNSHIDSINNLGINEFTKLHCFAELSSVMMCFEQTIKNKHNDNKRKYVGFGIRKTIYENYYRSIRKSVQTGTIPEPVNMHEPKKRRSCSSTSRNLYHFYFESTVAGKKHAVSINKNEVFEMFSEWCRRKNRQKKDAIYEALLLLMKENPVDGLGSPKDYAKNIDIEQDQTSVQNAVGLTVRKVKVEHELLEFIEDIIKRYNSDPENKAKPKLTFTMYAKQAFIAFNKKLPLKYVDPEAYQEYLKLKEETEYNMQ